LTFAEGIQFQETRQRSAKKKLPFPTPMPGQPFLKKNHHGGLPLSHYFLLSSSSPLNVFESQFLTE
jgi:hypothetical protein